MLYVPPGSRRKGCPAWYNGNVMVESSNLNIDPPSIVGSKIKKLLLLNVD